MSSVTAVVTVIIVLPTMFTSLYVYWDLGRRRLQRNDDEYRKTAEHLLVRFDEHLTRNDKALSNFLTEMATLTKYVERSRREAEGQLLTGKRR